MSKKFLTPRHTWNIKGQNKNTRGSFGGKMITETGF
jgi:hypothetical protein